MQRLQGYSWDVKLVMIYRRLRAGRDDHFDQSEAYDLT